MKVFATIKLRSRKFFDSRWKQRAWGEKIYHAPRSQGDESIVAAIPTAHFEGGC
jgi:hypothetical protein